MAELISLQPPGASPLRHAVSEAMSEIWTPNVQVLDTLWDPARCPPAALPYLASALGAPIWRTDWPVERRRAVVAATVALKRRRGTMGAFTAYLDQVDVTLVDFTAGQRPLATRPHRSEQDRQAWASQFPQLRIRQVVEPHTRRSTFQPGRATGTLCAKASVADHFAGPRGEVTAMGVSRPVGVRQREGSLLISLPERSKRFRPGHTARKAAPRASTAGKRIFAYAPGAGRPDLLAPGLTPSMIAPDQEHAPHTRGPVLRTGRSLGGCGRAARPSPVEVYTSQLVNLAAPGGVQPGLKRAKRGVICGRSRTPQAPFHVNLAVDLSFKKPGARLLNKPGRCVRAQDGSRLRALLEAARAAKLGRDKVLIRTGLYRVITAGDGVPADGSARLGQILRSF